MVAQLLFLESEDPDKDIHLYLNSAGGWKLWKAGMWIGVLIPNRMLRTLHLNFLALNLFKCFLFAVSFFPRYKNK